MPPLHNYEPSREIKQLYLKTRKADPALDGAPHPGLFQTAHAVGEALGPALALLLEIYGLANLVHVGNIALPAALALVAVFVRICSRRRRPRKAVGRSAQNHRKHRVRGAQLLPLPTSLSSVAPSRGSSR